MPVFNPNTPELREFLIMASADTRNLIQSIEANAATIAADKAAQDATNATNAAAIAAAQLAADTANSGVAAVNTVAAEISETMVINETFSVPMSAFVVQQSGAYHAVMNLVQVDGTKGVQLSLTDADGDDQGFSQLISPYLGDAQKATVELTANQLADSSYPLSFLCQGRKLAAMGGTSPNPPVAAIFKQLGNRPHYFRLDGTNLYHSADGVNADSTYDDINVSSAFMLTGAGQLWVALNDGNYYQVDATVPEGNWVPTTQSMYDSRIGFPDRVAL